jgi:hypothetical protein
MPANVDLKKIAEKNPRVDLAALEEGRRLREHLSRSGGVKRNRVVFPADRRRVRINDDVSNDPRVVTLGIPS